MSAKDDIMPADEHSRLIDDGEKARQEVIEKLTKKPTRNLYPPGRRVALAMLDVMMGQAGNARKLLEDMQARFEENPTEFYRTIVQPVLPKTAVEEVDTVQELNAGEKTVIVMPPNPRDLPSGGDHA